MFFVGNASEDQLLGVVIQLVGLVAIESLGFAHLNTQGKQGTETYQ